MTNYRWTICAMLFFATTVNYLDRQVLSLTWDEFIKPEFHWDESHYGTITSVFSIVYAICMLFAGRFASEVMISWAACRASYPPGRARIQAYSCIKATTNCATYSCVIPCGGALPGCCGVPELGLLMWLPRSRCLYGSDGVRLGMPPTQP